jgi:ABC-2 type transport system permease protein
MWAICTHEFKNYFKSIKSLIIIAILVGTTYSIADLMTKSTDFIELEVGDDGYAFGTGFVVYFLGSLFIAALSHDVINREISSRTARFLVTKTTRSNIVLGKFIGGWLFWLFCISSSFIIIFIISKKFLWKGLLECMIFISIALAINLLFSILLRKPGLSMFFGIIFGLVFPPLSFVAIYSDNVYINWFKFFTPYYYTDLGGYYPIINILCTGLLVLISIKLFNRRDL